jgi:hypothetical protein
MFMFWMLMLMFIGMVSPVLLSCCFGLLLLLTLSVRFAPARGRTVFSSVEMCNVLRATMGTDSHDLQSGLREYLCGC